MDGEGFIGRAWVKGTRFLAAAPQLGFPGSRSRSRFRARSRTGDRRTALREAASYNTGSVERGTHGPRIAVLPLAHTSGPLIAKLCPQRNGKETECVPRYQSAIPGISDQGINTQCLTKVSPRHHSRGCSFVVTGTPGSYQSLGYLGLGAPSVRGQYGVFALRQPRHSIGKEEQEKKMKARKEYTDCQTRNYTNTNRRTPNENARNLPERAPQASIYTKETSKKRNQ